MAKKLKKSINIKDGLKAPFPWFGGKSRVSKIVWNRLGADVSNYIEPFFGSGAILLGRPNIETDFIKKEIVNDKDGYIANFWRAASKDANAVWKYADWPMNECDLEARQLWLLQFNTDEFRLKLGADIDYYDARIAGYWVWGISAWIGSGWCSGDGPWVNDNGILTKLPKCVKGVRRKRPDLGGRGINRQRPQLTHEQGITRKLPRLAHGKQNSFYDNPIFSFMKRMRDVKVCCGDWKRVVSPAIIKSSKNAAIFLDPPYNIKMRDTDLYNEDEDNLSFAVRNWAIENGEDKTLRIALCGYEGEYEMPSNWDCVAWSSNGGYANKNIENKNKYKERIWFSPYCLKEKD